MIFYPDLPTFVQNIVTLSTSIINDKYDGAAVYASKSFLDLPEVQNDVMTKEVFLIFYNHSATYLTPQKGSLLFLTEVTLNFMVLCPFENLDNKLWELNENLLSSSKAYDALKIFLNTLLIDKSQSKRVELVNSQYIEFSNSVARFCNGYDCTIKLYTTFDLCSGT
jgi:hypothetical protein